MKQIPRLIKGGSHIDNRGTVSFVNDFDMTAVRRFYKIKHPDTTIIRGWRGHQIEQRWFYVNYGQFKIKVVEISDWAKPDPSLEQTTFILGAQDDCILHVPSGYATAIQGFQANSDLTIYSDYPIDNSLNDDYLFPINYFG